MPPVPVFHLVGGLDLLRREQVTDAFPQDGIPNSLDDWIIRDGVFCLKVKLQGRNLAWDLARTPGGLTDLSCRARRAHDPTYPARLYLTADTNEQCESPDYIVEYLRKLRRTVAAGLRRGAVH